jgi:hypothetical protein
VFTWRSRLFLRVKGESIETIQALKKTVLKWRAFSKQHLRVHRLISEQMLKRYSYLKLPDKILENIQQKIYISLLEFDPDSVRKLIIQIEALFVFAILKSTLNS